MHFFATQKRLISDLSVLALFMCLFMTLSKISALIWQLGKLEQKLEVDREARSIYMQALGPEHPKTQGILPFIHIGGPAAASPQCGLAPRALRLWRAGSDTTLREAGGCTALRRAGSGSGTTLRRWVEYQH